MKKNVDDMSNNNMKSVKSDLQLRNSVEKSSSKDKKHFWNKDSHQHQKSKDKDIWNKESHHPKVKEKDSSSFFSGRFLRKNPTQNGSDSSPAPHTATAFEDQQLSWAAAESMRMEEERRQRQEQENADLALALALSRLDSGEHRLK